MRADNIIDLLKDYTALIVISEIDNAVFLLAKHGYLGNRLQQTAHHSEEVEVQDRKVKRWRYLMFLSLVFVLFGLYSAVIHHQDNMIFLDNVYPYCRLSFEQKNGRKFTIQDLHELSNGKCDNFQGFGANINLCGFENDECRDLNDDYPDCNPIANALNERIRKEFKKKQLVDMYADTADEFISRMHSAELSKGDFPQFKPIQIGDGICHKDLDTLECNFDGNDCVNENDECNTIYKGANYTFKLGDGECDIFMNTEECDWDNGDCLSENNAFDIKAYNVDCGGHKALTCGQCVFAPGGQIDQDLCKGNCSWDYYGNFCKGNDEIRCKEQRFQGFIDVFADYSQSFFEAVEDREEISKGIKQRDLYDPWGWGTEPAFPTCGSFVYDNGLFTTSDNCGSKSADGKIIGPDCFWNDQEQECQNLNTVHCSSFEEDKDECSKFEKCFFNEQRNLCEDNCSLFSVANDCSDFCHFERWPFDLYYVGTCTQAICNDFGTEGECNGQDHCIYDEINSKCSYKCKHIS